MFQSEPSQSPRRKQRCFQFRLRTLLVFIVLMSGVFALWGVWYNSYTRCRHELFEAARRGELARAEQMLRRKPELATADVGGYSMLHWAAEGGNGEIVRNLIRGGADVQRVEWDGRMALHWAATRGQLAAVQELVASGADLRAKDANGNTPLDWAKANNRIQVVNWITQELAGPAGGVQASP